ncbi:MAG: CDP-archaeol synthase [Patescibacteria group bacterium]|nr:CDP-archaeol synthase [Patescibacteria group bacterium]MDD5715575.1 CDP-archaeol synthase [Patescibacteria group bacterium]
MVDLILKTVWFFLPTGIANLAASLSRFIPILGVPVDFGRSWRGKRVFGDHKTWRGIIFGTLFGVLTFLIQRWLYRYNALQDISMFNYTQASWAIGLLQGLGAVWGDALKSFFKRRINREPGVSWFPFDQVDYSIGAFALVSIVYFPGWAAGFMAILLGILVHTIFNLLGYALHLQKNKF